MIHNLYIGDSSDDEEKIQDMGEDKPNQRTFTISTYLISKGKSLLDNIRPFYRKQKLELKKQLLIPDIEIDRNLLGDYILYKNQTSKDQVLTEKIAGSRTLLEEAITRLDPETWRIAIEERAFFQEHLGEFFDKIKQELFKLFASQEPNPAIYNVLGIEQHNPKGFLAAILRDSKLFKGNSNFIEIVDVFRQLIHEESNIRALKAQFLSRKYEDYKDYPAQDFLSAVSDIYLGKLYRNENKKSISTIYSEFQQLLEIDLSHFHSLHRKWSGTNLENTFITFLKAQEEDLDLHKSMFLIEIINSHNSEINRELLRHRPSELFNGDFSDNLVKFLLEHRILRSKIKEQGIKHENRDITHNKYLPLDQTDEKVSIYATGARSDQRFLRSGDSYEEISEKIITIGIRQVTLKECFVAIINGNKDFLYNLDILNDNQVYLYKLADLLFNLETERNISAFITNAMFFDLVSSGVYSIIDLPNKLPMAISGAVDISRYANEYSDLIKRHKFDYKRSDVKIWDFLEFDVKNCQLLFDWIKESVALEDGEKESIINPSSNALSALLSVVHNVLKIKSVLSQDTFRASKKRKSVDLQENDILVEGVDDAKQVQKLPDFCVKINELLELGGIIKAIAEQIDSSKSNTDKYKDFIVLAMQSITPLIEEQYTTFARILGLKSIEQNINDMLISWYPAEVKALGDQFTTMDIGDLTE